MVETPEGKPSLQEKRENTCSVMQAAAATMNDIAGESKKWPARNIQLAWQLPIRLGIIKWLNKQMNLL